jgi:hypothetical protein
MFPPRDIEFPKKHDILPPFIGYERFLEIHYLSKETFFRPENFRVF